VYSCGGWQDYEAAARHMHVYGTTRHQLAAVAVAAREWARINPDHAALKMLSTSTPLRRRRQSRIRFPNTIAASFPMGRGPNSYFDRKRTRSSAAAGGRARRRLQHTGIEKSRKCQI